MDRIVYRVTAEEEYSLELDINLFRIAVTTGVVVAGKLCDPAIAYIMIKKYATAAGFAEGLQNLALRLKEKA